MQQANDLIGNTKKDLIIHITQQLDALKLQTKEDFKILQASFDAGSGGKKKVDKDDKKKGATKDKTADRQIGKDKDKDKGKEKPSKIKPTDKLLDKVGVGLKQKIEEATA